MAHLGESAASLRIVGDELIPDEITSLLKCAPSSSEIKGQIIRNKSGLERTAKTGGWCLDAPKCEPEDLNYQVSFLLEKMSNDLTVWGDINSRFRIDLFCGLFMSSGDEGLTLSSDTLRELGVRGIELGLCLYAP